MFNIVIYHNNINEYNKIKKIISDNFNTLIDIVENINEKQLIENMNVTHIDIIIIDINVSTLNEINFIQIIYSLFPNCKIILLLAYDMLDYIHYSTHMIVMDYIFKPYNEFTIINIVKKAIKKTEENKQSNIILARLNNIRKSLANELFPALLGGFINNEYFEQFIKETGIFFRKGFFAVIKFNFDENIPIPQKKYLKKVFSEYIYQWEVKEYFTILLYDYCDYIYMFANLMEDVTIEYIIDCFSNLEKNIKQGFLTELRIGISGFFNIKSEVKIAFYKAQNAEKQCNENKNIVLYSSSSLELNFEKKETEYGKLLYIKLSKGELDTVYYMIDNILDKFTQNSKNNTVFRKKTYEFFVIILNELSNEYKLTTLSDIDLFKEIIECKEIDKISGFLKDLSRNCSYEIEKNVTKRNVKILILTSNYIKENYNKNITLKYLAQHIGISNVYLSKIFKPYFGQSFNDYLTKIRIQKAKELLKNPFSTINEISSKVGYTDSNYFAKVFKKYTSMTPTEYRNKQV